MKLQSLIKHTTVTHEVLTLTPKQHLTYQRLWTTLWSYALVFHLFWGVLHIVDQLPSVPDIAMSGNISKFINTWILYLQKIQLQTFKVYLKLFNSKNMTVHSCDVATYGNLTSSHGNASPVLTGSWSIVSLFSQTWKAMYLDNPCYELLSTIINDT